MPIVETSGRTDGPAYLMIHGSPIDYRSWQPLASCAPREVRVALLALPDHSPRGEEPHTTLADYLSDISEAAVSLDRPVTLVGHSLGAYLAVRAAAQLGEQIQRLVLVAGLDRLPDEIAEGMRSMVAALEQGALSLEQLQAALIDLWLGEPPHEDEHVATLRRSIEAFSAQRLARLTRRVLELAQPDAALSSYATPTTVIHAKGDQAVPYHLGEALSRLGSRAELVTVDGSSHLPQLTSTLEIARWTFRSEP